MVLINIKEVTNIMQKDPKDNIPKQFQPKIYSAKHILTKLHTHCVVNKLSKYTVSQPTWHGINKRCKNHPDFAEAVDNILAQADEVWNQIGLDNLHSETLQFPMYKLLTSNKAYTRDHLSLELEDKLNQLLGDK